MKTELEIKTKYIDLLKQKIFLLEVIECHWGKDDVRDNQKAKLKDLQEKIYELEWILKG